MAADELTALQRAAGVVSELDPATAWDLDGQLDGLAQVTLTIAEGMGTWSERLHGIGLHRTVTEPVETGITGLGEIAASLTQSRRALRTAYAGFFAQAEANVRTVDRPAFWGENAVPRGRHVAPPPAPAGEPVSAPAGWPAPGTQSAGQPAAAAAFPRGQVEPGGGPMPDVAGLTGLTSGYWHGSDVVPGPDETKVWLGLVRYAEPGREATSTYVAVDTAAGSRWDPDGTDSGIVPALSPKEAAQLADELDDLIALAQSGAAAAPPTKLAKLADRLRGLLGDAGVTVIGNEGETEVSAAMIRQLLDAAAPAPAAPTRRKVTAKDCDQDNMDNGTVWVEIDASGAAPAIAVTAVEGNEQPEDYPEGYTTTTLPLADASQLAAKLRRFAQEAPKAAAGGAVDQPAQAAQGPDRPEPDPVVDQVRRAYENLAARPGDYVALTDIRDAVPVKDRERVDQALRKLIDDEQVRLEPEPFGHRIGAREKQAAIHLGGEDRHKLSIWPSPAASAPAAVPAPAPAEPRRVSNTSGKQFEYDPGTGATAVIEADGWRAVVPPSSSTGIAARLLYWQAEIKDGRGADANDKAARALLGGLSSAELREVASEIGAAAPGARTKSQLTDAIVNMAVSAPLKYRGLRRL
jgi:hypothetical protein